MIMNKFTIIINVTTTRLTIIRSCVGNSGFETQTYSDIHYLVI